MTIALTLKILITLGTPKRLTYHGLAFSVFSCVSVKLLPDFKKDPTFCRKPKRVLYLELVGLLVQESRSCGSG